MTLYIIEALYLNRQRPRESPNAKISFVPPFFSSYNSKKNIFATHLNYIKNSKQLIAHYFFFFLP